MTEVETRMVTSWVKGEEQYRRSNSVTFFDWDDTLFASSWACALEEGTVEDGDASGLEMEALERTVMNLLKVAHRMSTVFVVTNANMVWVDEVCQRWMPNVGAFLKKHAIQVISARDLHGLSLPERPALWKLRSFKDALTVLRSMRGHTANVIVIGDGEDELIASQNLRESERHSCVKMVRVRDSLTPGQLARQVSQLTMAYRNIFDSHEPLETEM